jgi:transposase
MPGPKVTPIVLTAEERTTLQEWARRGKTAQRLAQRSRIVLLASEGLNNSRIARRLRLTVQTPRKWRRRFAQDRLQGLLDEPRPGAPRKIKDADVERVITNTLEAVPEDATHWSTRSMAQHAGLSQTAISRIWRAFGLQPHRTETFKLSTDPLFVDKVRDVVGLYVNPPDHAIVLCVDEKSQVQAMDRTQPLLPLEPGRAACHTHDYKRYGTTSLFAALDVATGQVTGCCYRKHRHQELLKFLKHLDKTLPREPNTVIHLIMDNYGTHKTPAVQRWFLRHRDFQVHFTPTSASWINQVERFFAEITRKRIRRGTFRSVPALEAAIHAYLDCHNQHAHPFTWTADADLILDRVKNKCLRINNSGH